MTPTTVGWVLVDGQDADGPTLAREELTDGHRGAHAASTSEQATSAALQLQTMVEAHGQRLRGIGVTWSADAAAEAALLLESLTEAGFDNVIPVRFPQAAESLARGVDKIAGSKHTAVCVVESGFATVVMMARGTDGAPSTAQHAFDDDEGLVSWLAVLLAGGGWRPGVLVLAGTRTDLNALAVRLEAGLALPVFVRAGAQLGLARGAAQALGPHAEFTGAQPDEAPAGTDADAVAVAEPGRSWTLPYAGAVAMLVAGVLTFVVSLSAAVSLQLAPAGDPQPGARVAEAPAAPSVPHTVTPVGVAPPVRVPEPPPAESPEAPTALGSAWEDGPP